MGVPRFMTDASDERRALEKLTQTAMTGWYSPVKLARTAVDVAVSSLLGGRADYRLLEALGAPQRHFDHSKVMHDGKAEIWIDYVADVGDGFNSTFAVASLLGRPTLQLGGRETRRGDILVMGGDEVYPSASRKEYQRRLVRPYEAAVTKGGSAKAPELYAIPGNHDWYDGLTSFMRLFGQERTIGIWQTRQSRSYFALKLPHRWWLVGIDIQLESDIDKLQIDYFCDIARNEMRDGDRIILCTAEPDWVKGQLYDPNLQNNLAFFEKVLREARPGLEIAVRLAGDLHHYRRHESADGRQNIIAGGGGAFLHPTHGGSVEVVRSGPPGMEADYALEASYPTQEKSRSLTFGNVAFLEQNPGFSMLTALAYALASLSFVRPSLGTGVWAVAILGGFVAFTDTHKRWWRVAGGLLHGAAHMAAALAVTWGVAGALGINLLSGVPGSSLKELALTVIVGAAGAILGPTLMGLYLLLAMNGLGRHANEAFSSLKIQDYKNFLRLHIDEAGLTIYPVGIEKVPRAWSVIEGWKPGEPRIVPKEGPIVHHLIEEPIHVPATQAEATRDPQTARVA